MISSVVLLGLAQVQAQTTQYGAGAFNWDNGTTAAWSSTSGGPYGSVWTNGNSAVFEGSPGTVSIAATGVTAHNLTFNATGCTIQSNTLTLNGSTPTIACGNGSYDATISSIIAGTNGLTLSQGTVTLSGSNTFTGDIGGAYFGSAFIGTLVVQNSSALGTGNKTVYDCNNAGSCLVLDGIVGNLTLGGNISYQTSGAAGDGAIYNLAGNNVINGSVTMTSGSGNTMITAASGTSLTLNGSFTSVSGYSRTLILAGGGSVAVNGSIKDYSPTYASSVTMQGTGTWALGGTNTFTGATTLSAGTLDLANQNALLNSTLTMSGSGSLMFDSSVSGDAFTMGGLSASASGSGFNILLQNNAAAPIVLTVGSTNNASSTYAGVLSGSAGALVKSGMGTLTLSGVNTYTGSTTVSQGTLAVSGSGSIANSSLVSVAGGATLDVSGLSSTFTLSSSQTLSNMASATGTLGGNLATGSGTVAVSFASSTPVFTAANGTLTLASLTVFKVNNTGSALTNRSYLIIATNGGFVAGTAPSLVSVSGGGLTTGSTASLQISNNQLYLVVSTATATTATTTVLSSSLNPSSYGSSVIFTATIKTNSVTEVGATGNLAFSVDGALAAINPVASGSATYTNSWLATGSHAITAVYSGDSKYLSSTGSVSGGQTIIKQTPALTAPTAATIVYGQMLANSTLIGGSAINAANNAPVAGSFAFTTPNAVPNVGITNVSVVFTPTDTADYSNATTTASVPVIYLSSTNHAPGTGLTGQYYNDAGFGTLGGSLVASRQDPQVNFNWGAGSPISGVGSNNYSVRWSGQLMPLFSGTNSFYVMADTGARLWVNNRLIAARTFHNGASSELCGYINLTAGQAVNIMLEYIQTTNNSLVQLEWAGTNFSQQVIPTACLYPAAMDPQFGSILEERWDNVSGTAISTLTNLATYPDQPSGREFLLSFDCLQPGWSTNYGTKVSGYVVAPADGVYTFAVAASDTAQLYLGSETNQANLTLIAAVTNATARHDWSNQPGQISSPVWLQQGQRYYIMLLHKAGTGTNGNFSVAWQPPGAIGYSVIGAASLIPADLGSSLPTGAKILNTLASGHPRLFATLERFAWLQYQVTNNPAGQQAQWYLNLSNNCAQPILADAPVAFSSDEGLTSARTVQSRVYDCALVYRISGDTNYAQRAWMELTNAGSYTAWYSGVTALSYAEMTHGFAIGYDWLYDYWNASQRQYLATSMVNLGLNAGLGDYAYGTDNDWPVVPGNWNQVCNGGLALGALALGADFPAEVPVVQQILTNALASAPTGIGVLTCDNGGWNEGPGYWIYGTDYTFHMLAGLDSALGSDFGLSRVPGLSEAGAFGMQASSDNDDYFNWGDSNT